MGARVAPSTRQTCLPAGRAGVNPRLCRGAKQSPCATAESMNASPSTALARLVSGEGCNHLNHSVSYPPMTPVRFATKDLATLERLYRMNPTFSIFIKNAPPIRTLPGRPHGNVVYFVRFQVLFPKRIFGYSKKISCGRDLGRHEPARLPLTESAAFRAITAVTLAHIPSSPQRDITGSGDPEVTATTGFPLTTAHSGSLRE